MQGNLHFPRRAHRGERMLVCIPWWTVSETRLAQAVDRLVPRWSEAGGV